MKCTLEDEAVFAAAVWDGAAEEDRAEAAAGTA